MKNLDTLVIIILTIVVIVLTYFNFKISIDRAIIKTKYANYESILEAWESKDYWRSAYEKCNLRVAP